MVASIDSFRWVKSLLHPLREIPLAWFVLGLGIARAGVLLSTAIPLKRRFLWLSRCASAAGLFLLCTYLAITLCSLRSFMVQHDEANILSIAAATLHGMPMYHPPVSPDFSYSLMYGPLTFLLYRAALVAGGIHHFWIMRSTVVMAGVGVCAALFFLLRRSVSVPITLALLAFPISALLQHSHSALSLRADIWIVLFTALAILSSFLEVEPLAIILTALFAGMVIDLKITACIAILFPLLMLYRRYGTRAALYSFLLIVVVAFAPFALPNISLHNYISWLLFTRTEGLSTRSAFASLLFAVFLLSPLLLIDLSLRRFGSAFMHRIPELSIIAVSLLLAVLSSKNGSGTHYLWAPAVPIQACISWPAVPVRR